MKKVVLLLVSVALMSVGSASAQSVEAATMKNITRLGDSKWTVDLSLGLMAYQDLFLSGVRNEEAVVPGGTRNQDVYIFPLNFSADVYYRFSRHFSLGLRTTVGYKQIECFNGHKDLLGRFVGLPTTVVLTSKLSYFVGSEFEFYGLYGLGTTLMIVLEDYHWRPAPKVWTNSYVAEFYPIGLRWGRKEGIFYELGVGSKGVVNLGYFVNF